MKKLLLAAIAALSMAGAATARDTAVQVGRLSCDVAPGVGFVIGSSKDLECTFSRKGGRSEDYFGTIDKLGFDIGVTGPARIEWLVFSARDARVDRGSLAGTYVGGSHEATFGIGIGGNWLVGGSKRGYALQPLSISVQTGLNWSWTFSKMTLEQ